MLNGRLVQLVAGMVMVGAVIFNGTILPAIIEQSETHTLRYTDAAFENAPPTVVLGNAIGALRGVIVDVLWVRASIMKERGLYYEANTLAEMITKLQPRFAPVWTMQGHNMAYNISVATHTESERWEWVKKGIDLVRLRGLRYNPNNIELYKDLSYWFQHKIEGISDDAHLYYKRQFAREWHMVLGPPPYEAEERKAWIKKVADAPDTYKGAVRRTPLVAELVDTLREDMGPFEQIFRFDLNREFLYQFAAWKAVQKSWYAVTFKTEERMQQDAAAGQMGAQSYVAFNKLAEDPAYAEAWDTLLSFVRKKVLREDYNMDAQFMYELHDVLGPIDWRHASAHALYWARLGAKIAEPRSRTDEDIYKVINNDRMAANAIQDLARFGLMTYDPVADEFPNRLADTRWIPVVEHFFEDLYNKHKDVRGWGPDNFIAWHEHFMQSSVRELYRKGDLRNAEAIYKRLDDLYGTKHIPPTLKYSDTLENFVVKETKGEYEMQPHIAPTDVQSSLYYGIRFGLARNDWDVYEHSKKFADQVLQFFRTNDWTEFVNKFGEERITGIVKDLESIELAVFAQIMIDPTVPLVERFTLWNGDNMPLKIRRALYDDLREPLMREVQMRDQRLARIPEGVLFPEPLGMAEYRLAREAERRRREAEKRGGRAEIE